MAFFKEICLPGMTEDYKLPILYTYCHRSDLKIIYVCEEKNERVKQRLSELSNLIFADLFQDKLISFLEHSEVIMFNQISKLTDWILILMCRTARHQVRHYCQPFA